MSQSLEKYVGDVVHLGPDNSVTTKALFLAMRVTNKASRILMHRSLIVVDRNRILSRWLARLFKQRIDAARLDFLFAPAAGLEMACLNTDVPIVYYTDITWDQMDGYFPIFRDIASFGRKNAELLETCAIRKASATVFASAWAAESARSHYKADPHKVFIAPFGANLSEVSDREVALSRHRGHTLNLLWLGVMWEWKGADVAVACLNHLLEAGIDARLVTCGCTPTAPLNHPKIHTIPFLNKQNPDERHQLMELFSEAHFLIFPTRAEAFGIVVAEASAHGLPTIAANTGGVSAVLHDGQNGALLPAESPGSAYAKKIEEIWASDEQYSKLVTGSRDLFEKELNWDAWGRSMHKVFSQLSRGSGEAILSAQSH